MLVPPVWAQGGHCWLPLNVEEVEPGCERGSAITGGERMHQGLCRWGEAGEVEVGEQGLHHPSGGLGRCLRDMGRHVSLKAAVWGSRLSLATAKSRLRIGLHPGH
jgi:hypothetical protein